MLRLACLVFVWTACGSVKRPFKDDGGASEEPPLPTSSRAIVNSAGRVTGKTYTLDVQLGHPVSQQPASSATYKLEADTAVRP